MKKARRILLIGGTDSSGGAGLSADKEISFQLHFAASIAVAAITAQTDQSLLVTHPVPDDALRAQLKCAEQMGFGAIKIGMLPNRQSIATVRDFLLRHPTVPAVLDPVFQTSSKAELHTEETKDFLVSELLELVSLITPNAMEAELISGVSCKNKEDLEVAAEKIMSLGARAVLVKGGHLSGETCLDLLKQPTKTHYLEHSRLQARPICRGTGCRLATAIVCQLSDGKGLLKSVKKANEMVRDYIASTPEGS